MEKSWITITVVIAVIGFAMIIYAIVTKELGWGIAGVFLGIITPIAAYFDNRKYRYYSIRTKHGMTDPDEIDPMMVRSLEDKERYDELQRMKKEAEEKSGMASAKRMTDDGKCPHCDQFVGFDDKDLCPHCGNRILR